jgi:uncharacterized membrane protein
LVHERRPVEPGVERIVFFSDAVFAIAMTLLVIDLRPPDVMAGLTDREYGDALLTLIPNVFSYLLSFAVIGLYWIAHWRRFQLIDRSNQGLAFLNLVLLATIAFMPFPTALMGAQGDRPLVVVLYAVTLSVAGLLGTTEWLYARRAGLTRADLADDRARYEAVRGLAVPIVMLCSLVLLPIVGPMLPLFWTLIFVVQVLIVRRYRPHPQTTIADEP